MIVKLLKCRIRKIDKRDIWQSNFTCPFCCQKMDKKLLLALMYYVCNGRLDYEKYSNFAKQLELVTFTFFSYLTY